MSQEALNEGSEAFRRGRRRSENPFDPGGEDWMCWRDGFDQAKAAAERAANAQGPPAVHPPSLR